jgi:RNA polymerase sigma-70 factor (ECF subfamily)
VDARPDPPVAPPSAPIDAEVVGERRSLVSLAFRMLGTIAEAEDAVQEAYARWYRMSAAERDAIEAPGAWLTRVTSRICLDALGSARARRERYVGPWLPEPVPGDAFGPLSGGGAAAATADPLDRVSLDESVSTALLLVLESMTPAERVAFVLHDVFGVPFDEIAETVGRTPAACRQLAASARRRIDVERARRAPRAEHDRVVHAFAAAAATGDLAGLVAVLDPDVVLRSDGGGIVRAARKPVVGAERVARFLLGLAEKYPGVQVEPQVLPGGAGFVLWDEGRIDSVLTVEVVAGRIASLQMMRNPEKLTHWR